MSPKKSFADYLGNYDVGLRRLLCILEFNQSGNLQEESEPEQSQQQQWSILESLVSSPSVSTSILKSSAWLELLGIVVGYSKFTTNLVARRGSAKALSRLLWDPTSSSITGEKVIFSSFQT